MDISEDMWVSSEHVKLLCIISCWETHTQTTGGFHFTPAGTAVVTKADSRECGLDCGETEPLCAATVEDGLMGPQIKEHGITV